MDWTAKNVIVTGGGGGDRGGDLPALSRVTRAKVGVFDKNLDGARKIAQEIRGFASGIDITDYDAVAKAIAQFEKDAGPTDILVNNAGLGQNSSTSSTPRRALGPDHRRQPARALNMSHVVLKGMVARGHGRVVNIALGRPAASAPRSRPSTRPARAA